MKIALAEKDSCEHAWKWCGSYMPDLWFCSGCETYWDTRRYGRDLLSIGLPRKPLELSP
jgi:hypothetical protein